VLLVLVELDQLLEVDAVEVAKQRGLRVGVGQLGLRSNLFDDGLRLDLLLDVDRDGVDG